MSARCLHALLLALVLSSCSGAESCPARVCLNVLRFDLESLAITATEFELRVVAETALSCTWTKQAGRCVGGISAVIEDGALKTITWSNAQPGTIRLEVVADGTTVLSSEFDYVPESSAGSDGECDGKCEATTIGVR